jgi:hypothetical protein
MPQAGVPSRARRQSATPWWEELDRDAFQFPTEYRVKPARSTAPERRTVTIRGRGAERNLPVARPTVRRHERPGFRPDRAALWAVMLGLLLILVAATSAHAAILH